MKEEEKELLKADKRMNDKKRILVVIGTRPNFIKVTQFRKVAALYPRFELKIVHTGQHYDGRMADVFFQQFGLVPDFFLEVPPGNPEDQIAEISSRLTKTIQEFSPDLVMVVGDVNSTLAAAQTADRMGVKIAHVESGLRSFDESMPEEHNRVVADKLADILFVTEESGMINLLKEQKNDSQLFFVGNTMIDTMVAFADRISASSILEDLHIGEKQFVLMTMHRPGNVDNLEGLTRLLELVNEISGKYYIVFPVHPRTIKNMQAAGLEESFRNNPKLIITEPLDYFSFQKLIKRSALIITDSGGIQEESTFLKVPCLTLRPNTERPVTITIGSNELIDFEIPAVIAKISEIESGRFKKGAVPPLWDGKATERIFEVLNRIL
jgi:UDP-N-acetylglucosamine 2-epimerase (non-hydrolysing)